MCKRMLLLTFLAEAVRGFRSVFIVYILRISAVMLHSCKKIKNFSCAAGSLML